jgi:hypothetical protein
MGSINKSSERELQMKKPYYLALAIATATSTMAYASPEEHAMGHPSAAAEHADQAAPAEPTSNAEYFIGGNDITISPGKKNSHKIQLTSASVTAKPHQGPAEKAFDTKKFSRLWGRNGPFKQANPTATVTWNNGPNQYEMDVTLAGAASGKNGMTFTTVPTGAEGSFRKNGEPISQEEFFSAAAEGGKQDVAVWVNESSSEPNPSSSDAGTHPEHMSSHPEHMSSHPEHMPPHAEEGEAAPPMPSPDAGTHPESSPGKSSHN